MLDRNSQDESAANIISTIKTFDMTCEHKKSLKETFKTLQILLCFASFPMTLASSLAANVFFPKPPAGHCWSSRFWLRLDIRREFSKGHESYTVSKSIREHVASVLENLR